MTSSSSSSSPGSPSSSPPLVLVGHCGPDMFMLRSALGRVAPDSAIETVNDTNSLVPYLSPANVLLVNRLLDGRFETNSGIELIRDLAVGDAPPVMILISNFPESQDDARAAGAHPGFGKTALYDAETAETVRTALARAAGE